MNSTYDRPLRDPLNLKLIREVEIDPRQTNKSLAQKLGINPVTVANRVRDLTNAGVFKMGCHVDPVAVGYPYLVILGIVSQHDKSTEVANRIAACPRVSSVLLCSGRFNIVVYLSLPDQDHLLPFLSNELGAISGIRRVEQLIVLEVAKILPNLLSDSRAFSMAKAPIKNLDEIDLALVALLQQDASTKTSVLVQKLKIDKSTILRRIRRLETEGVIRFVAEIDPISLGYRGVASVYMKFFEPDKIKEAARILASYRNVQYVSITTGYYDVVTWALFRELDDLRHFLIDEIAKIPGSRETETMITLKVVKISFKFMTGSIE